MLNPRSYACLATRYARPLQSESPNSPTSAPTPQSQDRYAFSWEPVIQFHCRRHDAHLLLQAKQRWLGRGVKKPKFVAGGTAVIVQIVLNVGVERLQNGTHLSQLFDCIAYMTRICDPKSPHHSFSEVKKRTRFGRGQARRQPSYNSIPKRPSIRSRSQDAHSLLQITPRGSCEGGKRRRPVGARCSVGHCSSLPLTFESISNPGSLSYQSNLHLLHQADAYPRRRH